MQIVIDISYDLYVGIERRDAALETEYVCYELIKAVDHGTPLESILCRSVYTEALDKLRAEIEEHRNKTEHIDKYDLVGDCLDIINKYRKEV